MLFFCFLYSRTKEHFEQNLLTLGIRISMAYPRAKFHISTKLF